MDRKLFFERLTSKKSVLVVFVTGNNCVFCDRIKPYVYAKRDQFTFLHIDRERDSNLYSLLVTKKQIKGVPSLLAYDTENYTIYADLSISGINTNEIDAFFDKLDFL